MLLSASAGNSVGGQSFDFALIGDLQYTAREDEQFLTLRDVINDANVAFVIHDGDFKLGAARCSDELFTDRFTLFNTFTSPFIYIFGDNEWTDCHRPRAGGYDPSERLAKLRQLFTRGDQSLGHKPLQLTRQSKSSPFRKFRKNVRWTMGKVLFVGLNVSGSNNNFGRTSTADAEYAERNAANLVWMREAFTLATQEHLRGILFVIHGNPFLLKSSGSLLSGYQDFVTQLEQRTEKFGKPVVLVHGDTHRFRIDNPLPIRGSQGCRSGKPLANFTRVETFGSPQVGWVRGTVDADDPRVFRFLPEPLQ
jgi:hypothetical protein